MGEYWESVVYGDKGVEGSELGEGTGTLVFSNFILPGWSKRQQETNSLKPLLSPTGACRVGRGEMAIERVTVGTKKGHGASVGYVI